MVNQAKRPNSQSNTNQGEPIDCLALTTNPLNKSSIRCEASQTKGEENPKQSIIGIWFARTMSVGIRGNRSYDFFVDSVS